MWPRRTTRWDGKEEDSNESLRSHIYECIVAGKHCGVTIGKKVQVQRIGDVNRMRWLLRARCGDWSAVVVVIRMASSDGEFAAGSTNTQPDQR